MNTLFLYRTTPRIRLKEFNALAEPKVAEAVNELRGKGATSFVLDLRDNPGGLVQAGVEIARLFLPPDVNVAYTEGRVVAGGVKGDTDVDATATAAARAKARAQARGGERRNDERDPGRAVRERGRIRREKGGCQRHDECDDECSHAGDEAEEHPRVDVARVGGSRDRLRRVLSYAGSRTTPSAW